jgi:microcin C transport system permease protein
MFGLRRSPQSLLRWQRFKAIKRGYYSAIILLILTLLSFAAELFINNRALIVNYQNEWHFPTYGDMIPGRTFGLDYDYETNYKQLATQFASDKLDNTWVVMPLVPWGESETDLRDNDFPPYKPDSTHLLGSDTSGRDVLARLVYGFRVAMVFSILLLVSTYGIGIAIGCLMGFWGGAFDLIFQRVIEIWSNIPFLYVIMIVASIVPPGFWTLLSIMVFFGWTGMTWYMRTATYKENARDYVLAARAMGASDSRIIFRHILPNTLSTIITFIPFSVAGGITALTALDYLGFGLPPPTPSWGELLKQGTDNLESPWIVTSVAIAMSGILMLVTWIGEAVREAYDPRKFAYYE